VDRGRQHGGIDAIGPALAVGTLAALDFRKLGNDAPVDAVQVRRDDLALRFDASTLLGARGTN
jgi:hypothetical protein